MKDCEEELYKSIEHYLQIKFDLRLHLHLLKINFFIFCIFSAFFCIAIDHNITTIKFLYFIHDIEGGYAL